MPAKGREAEPMELLLPLILLVPLLLITFRARKQQRAFLELQSSLVAGQAVVTTAGLHGTIIELVDDVVVLEIAEGVRVRWARAAIAQVLPDSSGAGTTATAERTAAEQGRDLANPSTTPDPDGPRSA